MIWETTVWGLIQRMGIAIIDFDPNGATDILMGIVKMIYNLRILRQIYCANYPCPEVSTLTCEFDDLSRHQTTKGTWSDPLNLPFEKAFGCPS